MLQEDEKDKKIEKEKKVEKEEILNTQPATKPEHVQIVHQWSNLN